MEVSWTGARSGITLQEHSLNAYDVAHMCSILMLKTMVADHLFLLLTEEAQRGVVNKPKPQSW